MTPGDERGVRVLAVVRELSTWCPPNEAARDLLTHMGAYTDVLVERWVPDDGPTDAAMAWTDPHTLPSDATDLFHAQGIRVSLVAGSGMQGADWRNKPAEDFASGVAEFVHALSFDGVHLSCHGAAWEGDGAASDEARRVDWLCCVTQTLYDALPGLAISQSHDASHFGPGDDARVRRVHRRVGGEVDFYVVRYEAAVRDSSDACRAVFSAGPGRFAGTAIDELLEAGYPAEKLVVGLPVAAADGPGHIEARGLAMALRTRAEAQKPLVGLCGWYWATDRRVLGGRWSTRVADAILGEPQEG